MKVALILDDTTDNMVIMHLLLEHLGYDVMLVQEMQEGLRILSATPRGFLVLLGDTLDALATLAVVEETPVLQRHIYLLLMDNGEPLPAFARRVIRHDVLLVLRRPWTIALAIRAVEYAEHCLHQRSVSP